MTEKTMSEKAEVPTDKTRSSSWMKALKYTAAGVVGGVAAVAAAPVVLTAAGFTSAGIAAGSVGASMMSAAAVAGGGGVATGSVVAGLQSAGAAGLGAVGTGVVGGAGAAAAGGAKAAYDYVSDKKGGGNDKPGDGKDGNNPGNNSGNNGKNKVDKNNDGRKNGDKIPRGKGDKNTRVEGDGNSNAFTVVEERARTARSDVRQYRRLHSEGDGGEATETGSQGAYLVVQNQETNRKTTGLIITVPDDNQDKEENETGEELDRTAELGVDTNYPVQCSDDLSDAVCLKK